MKVLSFVIPAYNSEAFLRSCIDSMLVPAVLPQLEILVVNDGSTDTTADIAREYCSAYPDTVRLLEQENRGHGGALNTGCAAARGNYLKVIDADDTVDTESLGEFVRLLAGESADVVLTPHRTWNISTGQWKDFAIPRESQGKALTLGEVLAQWQRFASAMTFHGITYRREFYQNRGIQLPEHVFYEDFAYAAYPCCHADSVKALPVFVYHYRIGDKNQSVSEQNQLRQLHHVEKVLSEMLCHYAALTRQSSAAYAARKCHQLMLSYFTTCLLVCPDRKLGRKKAAALMAMVKEKAEDIYRMTRTKYRIFRLLNRLHVSKAMWDRFLESKFYHSLRKGN